jgi:hypothetical protein
MTVRGDTLFATSNPMQGIVGLSDHQQRCLEAALRTLPDPSWRENVRDAVAAALPGSAPWFNSDVQATLEVTFAGGDLGALYTLDE